MSNDFSTQLVRNIHRNVSHLRRFTCYDADGQPINLSTISDFKVEYFHGLYPNRLLYSTLTIGHGLTVIDASGGVVDMTLNSSFTSILDIFQGRFSFQAADGGVHTAPAPTYRVV